MFNYVLTGEKCKAIPIKSELSLRDLQEYVRIRSNKLHNDGFELIYRHGTIEFINPQILTLSDYGNCGAYII